MHGLRHYTISRFLRFLFHKWPRIKGRVTDSVLTMFVPTLPFLRRIQAALAHTWLFWTRFCLTRSDLQRGNFFWLVSALQDGLATDWASSKPRSKATCWHWDVACLYTWDRRLSSTIPLTCCRCSSSRTALIAALLLAWRFWIPMGVLYSSPRGQCSLLSLKRRTVDMTWTVRAQVSFIISNSRF